MTYDRVPNHCDRSKFSRQATSRSLCLLDEFGKGTLTEGMDFSALCIGIKGMCLWKLLPYPHSFLSTDGIGLLGGTISHFATCAEPPRVPYSVLLSVSKLVDSFRTLTWHCLLLHAFRL